MKVTCSSLEILEGELEIRVVDNIGLPMATILLPDQVYSPGRQEVEYLLPIQAHSMDQPLRIETRFRSQAGETYLSQGLLIPPQRRSFVCPIVRGMNSDVGGDDYNWLSLEGRCPKAPNNSTLAPMLTQLPQVSAADLPRDPLKHLPHDIIILEAGGWKELAAQQVVALEAWVRGGGSLFLQIDEEDVEEKQQEFLDRLIAPMPDLLADEVEGTQLIPIIRQGTYAAIEYGFGHVLLTTERSWTAANEADKREIFGFLWRLRNEQFTSVRQSGMLTIGLIQKESLNRWNNYEGLNAQQLQAQVQLEQAIASRSGTAESTELEVLRYWERTLFHPRSARPKEMIQALLPRDVQSVPAWLIGSFILVYIAAIGFGDYILLGKIKRRRWTWFTFPAMTVLVSLLSIGTAKGYLSSSIEISSLEYRDVTDDGQIARIQRFDLHYRSSPGRQLTELDQVAFTPVTRQSAQMVNNPRVTEEMGDQEMVPIRGVPTQKAVTFQDIQQWRPQLNRMVSFPLQRMAPPAPKLPASGLRADITPWKSDLKSQIQRDFPEAIYYELFAETGTMGIANSVTTPHSPESLLLFQLASNCQRPDATQPPGPLGVFSLFHQVSPSADTGLADLAIASPGHLVLCVAVREPSGLLVIYRYRLRTQS